MRPGMTLLLIFSLAGCAPAATPPPTITSPPVATATDSFTPIEGPCPVTLPGPGDILPEPNNDWNLTNADKTLFTIPWPDGVITFEPDGAGFVEADGALAMKWPWYRNTRGKVTVTGRRLDAPAPPLRFEANDGYGDTGFQPMYLIFPTEGCWEVTGRVEESELTFVTLVVNNRD